MRLVSRAVGAASALAAILLLVAPGAQAQAPEVLLPEQSAAKAKELLQQAIAALGGPAYLGVRDISCTGRASFFSSQGTVSGYDKFFDFAKLPDKNRTEFSKKRSIINVYNGREGWTLDRGGVQELPASAVEEFLEGLSMDMDNLLRFRLKEEGMVFRYGGSDVVDLKQVDWVELADRDHRTFRLALDRATRLPIRAVVTTRNPTTRERTEEVTYFSNYHAADGVQTPFQVTRERNGLKVYQVFYSECHYNTGLADDMFTRAALEKRWVELPQKKKK